MKKTFVVDIERKSRAEFLKTAVMDSLKWNESQYGEFQYKQGLLYLDTYLPEDSKEYGEYVLTRSRIFWNWWKNHWQHRDKRFLKDTARTFGRDSIGERVSLYRRIHNGRFLASQIHPNRVVMDDSYTAMVERLITTEKSK